MPGDDRAPGKRRAGAPGETAPALAYWARTWLLTLLQLLLQLLLFHLHLLLYLPRLLHLLLPLPYAARRGAESPDEGGQKEGCEPSLRVRDGYRGGFLRCRPHLDPLLEFGTHHLIVHPGDHKTWSREPFALR